VPIDPDLFRLYLVAVGILVLMPGPDSLLVLTRSIVDGRRAGVMAATGITLGNLIHTIAAAAGVSALVVASPILFDILRYAGTAYLAWIGVQALAAAWNGWRGRASAPPETADRRQAGVFGQGLLTNLLNAKVILFYLAFVPQFVAPALGDVPLQILLLGVVLAIGGFGYLLVLTVLASGAAQRALRSPAVRTCLDAVSGVLFLGFAVRLVLTERRFA